MSRRARIWVTRAALSLLVSASLLPARADTACQLKQFAALPLDTEPDGEVDVPSLINGQKEQLLIDTGSMFSSVSEDAANRYSLERKPIPGSSFEFVNGIESREFVHIDSFQLGSASLGGADFIVIPDAMVEPDASGMLGPNLLKAFDIEFDFVGGKVNAFLPNSCPIAPVYWTQDAFAEVPMKLDRFWHIVVPAQLDGQAITVLIDTGSERSLMSLEAARNLFGWDEKNPLVKQLPSKSINGGRKAAIYSYPFSTLAFEGIQVSHPDIMLIPQGNLDRRGRPDAQVILGMSVLRQLHLYVGYQAQKLYLTAAEAH
jgi:predicted aspartyl protease